MLLIGEEWGPLQNSSTMFCFSSLPSQVSKVRAAGMRGSRAKKGLALLSQLESRDGKSVCVGCSNANSLYLTVFVVLWMPLSLEIYSHCPWHKSLIFFSSLLTLTSRCFLGVCSVLVLSVVPAGSCLGSVPDTRHLASGQRSTSGPWNNCTHPYPV